MLSHRMMAKFTVELLKMEKNCPVQMIRNTFFQLFMVVRIGNLYHSLTKGWISLLTSSEEEMIETLIRACLMKKRVRDQSNLGPVPKGHAHCGDKKLHVSNG